MQIHQSSPKATFFPQFRLKPLEWLDLGALIWDDFALKTVSCGGHSWQYLVSIPPRSCSSNRRMGQVSRTEERRTRVNKFSLYQSRPGRMYMLHHHRSPMRRSQAVEAFVLASAQGISILEYAIINNYHSIPPIVPILTICKSHPLFQIQYHVMQRATIPK